MAATSHHMPRRSQGEERRIAHDVEKAKPAVEGLGAFWTKLSNDWVLNLSGLLAYNLLMSIFPILLVLLAVGGFILGSVSSGGRSQLETSIANALPGGTGQALLVNVTHNLNHNAGLLFIVGIVVAIFTGSRLFITLENSFGIVFRLRSRDLIRQNLMAIGMLLLYVVLVPFLLLASIIPPTILRALNLHTAGPVGAFLFQAAGVAVAIVSAALLFGAIYVVVPNRRVEWREVWKGTLVAAVLLVIYEALFPLYVSLLLHPGNYGSTAGFAVVILVFFYYLGFIVLLGAEVNSWAAGQRQTAGDIDAILHEVQAHNTTRGAAGPTAGTPQEDIEHHEGAAAMQNEQTAIEHERRDHHADVEPPKYAESGVEPPGYRKEPDKGRQDQGDGRSAGEGSSHVSPDNPDNPANDATRSRADTATDAG